MKIKHFKCEERGAEKMCRGVRLTLVILPNGTTRGQTVCNVMVKAQSSMLDWGQCR